MREILFDDVQKGRRTVPLTLTVHPLDKPAEQTVMHYRDLEFDLPLARVSSPCAP